MSKNVNGRILEQKFAFSENSRGRALRIFKTKMSRQAVRDWLALLTMEKYTDNFLERGYDCIAHCKLIINADLIMLGVDNANHRKLLLDGVQFLMNSPDFASSEPCQQKGRSVRGEENICEWSAVNKYSELFKYLDTPRHVHDAPPQEFPKMQFTMGSSDPDELPLKTSKPTEKIGRKNIELMEANDSNFIVID